MSVLPRLRPSSSGSTSMSLSRRGPSRSRLQSGQPRLSRSFSRRPGIRSPRAWSRACATGRQRHGTVDPADRCCWQTTRTLARDSPSLRRLAILANVGSPAAALEMREIQATARALGLEVATIEIRRAEDIAPAFEALKGHAEALYVVGDPLVICQSGYASTPWRSALGCRRCTSIGSLSKREV